MLVLWLTSDIDSRYLSVLVPMIGAAIIAAVAAIFSKKRRMWVVDFFALLFSWYAFSVVRLLLIKVSLGYTALILAAQLLLVVLLLFIFYAILERWRVKYWLRVTMVLVLLPVWSLVCLFLVRYLTASLIFDAVLPI